MTPETKERRNRILGYLRDQPNRTTVQIRDRFQQEGRPVSEGTIRHDLAYLVAVGALEKSEGVGRTPHRFSANPSWAAGMWV